MERKGKHTVMQHLPGLPVKSERFQKTTLPIFDVIINLKNFLFVNIFLGSTLFIPAEGDDENLPDFEQLCFIKHQSATSCNFMYQCKSYMK